jgi:hypothetical protein
MIDFTGENRKRYPAKKYSIKFPQMASNEKLNIRLYVTRYRTKLAYPLRVKSELFITF